MIKHGKLMCACGISLALALSGCANGQLARPQGPASPEPATEIEAATVTVACGGDSNGTALVAPLAAIAAVGIDFAVDIVGKLLKDAQTKRNAVWSASGIAKGCTVKGQEAQNVAFTLQRAVLNGQGITQGTPGFQLTGTLTFTRQAGTGEKPKDVITVEFKPDPEAERAFIYGRTSALTRGSGRKHVVILLAFSENPILKTSEATGIEDAPLAMRIDLGTLTDRRFYSGAMLRHVQATTALPAPVSDNLVVTAIVVESENELIALRALTDAYDGNKDQLVKALRETFGVEE